MKFMSETASNKIVKMKEIMRLFLKYETDILPIVDKKKKFKGFIYKNIIIHDAVDAGYIEKPFAKLINKYLEYPKEEDFLVMVSKFSDNDSLPIVDNKGNFIQLWNKKDLINHYYDLFSKEKEKNKEIKFDLYKEILKCLPYDIIITDSNLEIVLVNSAFLNEFDFEENIVLKQKISKFFPSINKIQTRSNMYPKIHNIKYRHVDWYYSIINFKQYYIFIFSLSQERLIESSKKEAFIVDKPDIQLEKTIKDDQAENREKTLPEIIENQELFLLKDALEKNDWNIAKTARTLKIPRQTLQYKISKYKIT